MYEAMGIRRYQETAVQSVGPEKLVVLVYEALLRDLRQGYEAARDGEIVRMLGALKSAQGILVELRTSLDHEIGGEIARNLESLYDFMFHENLAAMVDHDPDHFRNNLRILAPLLHAWSQIPPGTAERAARELGRPAPAPHPGPGPDPARNASDTTGPAPEYGKPVLSTAPADPPREGEAPNRLILTA
jgi:flagellar protein FliS